MQKSNAITDWFLEQDEERVHKYQDQLVSIWWFYV